MLLLLYKGAAVAAIIPQPSAQEMLATLRRAVGEQDSKNFVDAIADYSTLEAAGYHPAELYEFRAMCLLQIGKYDQAISDCGTALTLEPNDEFTLKVRARCLKKEGKYALALADLDSAIGVDRNDNELYVLRGEVYCDVGKFALGINDLTTAIKNKPKDADLLTIRAVAFLLSERSNDARKDITLARKLGNPDDDFHRVSAAIDIYNRDWHAAYVDYAAIFSARRLKVGEDSRAVIGMTTVAFRLGYTDDVGKMDAFAKDWSDGWKKDVVLLFSRREFRSTFEQRLISRQLPVRCYYYLGIVDEVAGMKEKARAEFSIASEDRSPTTLETVDAKVELSALN